MSDSEQEIPLQPIEKPIICSPYVEPDDHWLYDRKSGEPSRAGFRRQAGYWFKTGRTGSSQKAMFVQEERDDLPLVNLLRDDVRRWREADYRGASNVTKDLLHHWARKDRHRRLFFCQREAVETIIYLAEMRIPGRSRRTGFQKFKLSENDLCALLEGRRPSFNLSSDDYFPTLLDQPADLGVTGLRRLGCKMATGSGKTVVMSMLIAWAFCNRGQNPESSEFPEVVLVCCPNLTVKERLQVLRPDRAENYYAAFDIVPTKYRPLMQKGKVLITNWHALTPEEGNKEGCKAFAVVNKGPETPETFAHRIIGGLADRGPIMVLNDEGHHCWRSKSEDDDAGLSGDEKKEIEAERNEATIWTEGIDKLNNRVMPDDRNGIALCIDLSATPFYIKGSGHPEGRPFPWLVSDFSLIDAIESGIVKIPRLPVQDTTGRPDPLYFRLWEAIKDKLTPADLTSRNSKKPKPEVVYRHAHGALLQIAGQWVERFQYIQEGNPGQDKTPPVLIIVCDNTDVAEIFFRMISGEHEVDAVTEEDIDEVLENDETEESESAKSKKVRKPSKRIAYGAGEIFPEYFANKPGIRRTVRIDSKLLAEAESREPGKSKQDAADELRSIVSTVGRAGEPGEHVRCVVSVSMLTEGWDANNVTQILGIRAFGSQLLCEQVVGRGLRRMDYDPDPKTNMLTEEYVDVYGIPFSVIPFRGRPTDQPQPIDKPKQHVRALSERAEMEMRYPIVEGYAFSLKKNLIRCDIDTMESLLIQPDQQPTVTAVSAPTGYQTGSPSTSEAISFEMQDRKEYYASTHLQTIMFQAARQIVNALSAKDASGSDQRRRVFRLKSRHHLFPQVFRFVEEYVLRKVDFQNANPCELGLQEYFGRLVDRLIDGIVPDETEGETPLLPLLNRYNPIGTTADVEFKTTRPCFATTSSHINQVVADTKTWETSAAFRLEKAVQEGVVKFYARNDGLGLVIPYEYDDNDHNYEPDFLVRLAASGSDLSLVLEIKGHEDDQAKAKHQAAQRWISAVNNWGQLGCWDFHVCRNPQTLDKELANILKKFEK